MDNKKVNKKIKEMENEREFIPSYFNWVSLEEQKENTERFENITKKDND